MGSPSLVDFVRAPFDEFLTSFLGEERGEAGHVPEGETCHM